MSGEGFIDREQTCAKAQRYKSALVTRKMSVVQNDKTRMQEGAGVSSEGTGEITRNEAGQVDHPLTPQMKRGVHYVSCTVLGTGDRHGQ